MKRRWLTTTLLMAVVLVSATGCATEPDTVCDEMYICYGPGHVSTPDDHVVAFLVTFSLVPVLPGSADGPARIVQTPFRGY